MTKRDTIERAAANAIIGCAVHTRVRGAEDKVEYLSAEGGDDVIARLFKEGFVIIMRRTAAKGASMDSLKVSDAAAGAVATHPRVTLADIEGAIAARFDFTADRVATSAYYAAHFEVPKAIESLKLLSICLLVMRNGFTVIGHSAPASPENFNPDFGRKLAYENAVRQLWPLMGFALRDKLAAAAA